MVSSNEASLGLMQAIMSVRLLPPSESCRMRVSLLSRYLNDSCYLTQGSGCNFRGEGQYGTCVALRRTSPRADITLPNTCTRITHTCARAHTHTHQQSKVDIYALLQACAAGLCPLCPLAACKVHKVELGAHKLLGRGRGVAVVSGRRRR